MSAYRGVSTSKHSVTGVCPACKSVVDDFVQIVKVDRQQYSVVDTYLCYSCFLKEALKKAGIHYIK